MKKILYLLVIVIFTFSACKKNDILPASNPKAGFSLSTEYKNNDTSQSIIMATYDGFILSNNSANSDAYLWDFGNATTSNEKSPNNYYTKSGTYLLTLTAFTKDGRKSVSSKTIKVLDRVAKQIVISSLTPQSALGWSTTYPNSGRLNLWVEILKAAPNQEYPLSAFGVPQAPLVYKTSVATDIDASKLPLTFNISDKLIIDFPTLFGNNGYTGLGYIVNLYAQDNTGTYLIVSSYGSGGGFTMSGNIYKNEFTITTGLLGSNLSMNGDYE